jgi:hypothetical protein
MKAAFKDLFRWSFDDKQMKEDQGSNSRVINCTYSIKLPKKEKEQE